MKGKWKNGFQDISPLHWSQREKPLTEEVTSPVPPGATGFCSETPEHKSSVNKSSRVIEARLLSSLDNRCSS